MIIANIASFPARSEIIEETVKSLYKQVDKINLCLNEYVELPSWVNKYKNLNAVIPDVDYKDIGKFIFKIEADDYVILVDDDIEYPSDYVARLMELYAFVGVNCVLGLHSIIYSDYFDGLPTSRNVRGFNQFQNGLKLVNQLGTGTVFLKGEFMPSLEFMSGSEKYVDLRFSVSCFRKNLPLISIPREKGWMDQKNVDSSIFEDFTVGWSSEHIQECMEIAGYSKLNMDSLKYVKFLNQEFQTYNS